MIAASASFTNCPAYAGTEASNRLDASTGLRNGRPSLAATSRSISPKAGREVDDAGALVDRDEVRDHHAVGVAADRQDVERAPVAGARRARPRRRARRSRRRRRAPPRPDPLRARPGASRRRARALDVADVGTDGDRDVGDQRPRRRRPDEEVVVAIDDREADVHRRLGHVLVPLRDLVARERGAAPAAVRHDLEALVDRALVPHRLQVPPHALDVGVRERPVRVCRVDPHPDPRGQRGPVLHVALHRLAAAGVELRDPELLDLLLAVEAELLLDLELDRQPVAVPAALAGDVAAADRVEPRIEVLEGAGPHVMEAGLPVRGRRSLVEHPLACTLAPSHALGEHVVVDPSALDAFLERDEIELAIHGSERHVGERIERISSIPRGIHRADRARDARVRARCGAGSGPRVACGHTLKWSRSGCILHRSPGPSRARPSDSKGPSMPAAGKSGARRAAKATTKAARRHHAQRVGAVEGRLAKEGGEEGHGEGVDHREAFARRKGAPPKASAQKKVAKKAPPKKAVAKKAPPKKVAPKKAVAKKATTKKQPPQRLRRPRSRPRRPRPPSRSAGRRP